MSNLRVKWAEDGSGVVRNRRDESSRFAADLSRLTDGLGLIEAAQADILLRLWLADAGSDSSDDEAGGGGDEAQEQRQRQVVVALAEHEAEEQQHEAQQAAEPAQAEQHVEAAAEQQQEQQPPAAAEQEQEERQEQPAEEQQQQQRGGGAHVRAFLDFLIAKNHGAMRHVPPPGLSDQTCLVSAVFALLRLMNERVSRGRVSCAACLACWGPYQSCCRMHCVLR